MWFTFMILSVPPCASCTRSIPLKILIFQFCLDSCAEEGDGGPQEGGGGEAVACEDSGGGFVCVGLYISACPVCFADLPVSLHP